MRDISKVIFKLKFLIILNQSISRIVTYVLTVKRIQLFYDDQRLLYINAGDIIKFV